MQHAMLTMAMVIASTAVAAGGKPYNVLFFAVDDLRPEFGAYGQTYVKSPTLDGIARSGIVFRRAYCQQAVCSPSRSSLLTGTRPDTTKVWDLVTHFRSAIPDVVTLPQHFKNNGYFVQGMGKLFHGGYDDPPSWSTPWQAPKAPMQYGSPANQQLVAGRQAEAKKAGRKAKELQNASKGPAVEGADVPDNFFHDGALADLAVKTLGELKTKNQPFWLGVGFIKPHLPFVAPKKYWDLYDPSTIKLASNPFRPKGAPDYAILDGGELRSYAGIPKDVPDDLARQLKHGYYASISYMDAQMGRVIAELERLGLRENTIIVVWGDHGWKLGEHQAWCKHSACENDANAPLLVSVPGSKTAGQSTNALVEFVDIYPTLADLCGLSLPSHLEGTSFAPVIQDPNRAWKPAAFSQYPRSDSGKGLMGYSMRTDRYRFTRWVEKKDLTKIHAIELYDHQTDPAENVNIANEPANAGLVAQLTEQWQRGWQGAKPTK